VDATTVFRRTPAFAAAVVIGRLEAFVHEHVLPVVAEVIHIHLKAATPSAAGQKAVTAASIKMPSQLSSSTIWIKSTASRRCRASSNVSSPVVDERHVYWIEAGMLRRREKG
jgi:hypothetical protein